MREILFRAKRRGDEKWVYGYYAYTYENFDNDEDDRIYEHATGKDHVIYRDTLGQYTGLTDKNGKKIFEGDIVKADYDDCWVKIYEVIFYNGGFKMRSKYCATIYDYSIHEEHPDFEVIGNIWDNPELLEEQK